MNDIVIQLGSFKAIRKPNRRLWELFAPGKPKPIYCTPSKLNAVHRLQRYANKESK